MTLNVYSGHSLPPVMTPNAEVQYSNRIRRPIEATMIQGTTVKIGCAHLSMVNHQVNEENSERASDFLRANCSFAAVVDAGERYDPPRCTKATRRNILRKMEDWIFESHHSVPSSIFWLYGGAGAGKSALAQTLAENFKTNLNEDLAASFFFFKTDVNRNNGDRLIPTLALQLVQSFQGLAPFVERNILRNPDLFKKSRQSQMLELIVQPLTKLWLEESCGELSKLASHSHPRLVVIDGLDECHDSDIQCDLLRIIASAVSYLPYPLRFLITSRPESHITRTFQHDEGLKEVARYNLSVDSDADEDIRKFLEGEFAKIRCTHLINQHLPSQWPSRGAISSIVERSSGHFIYAATVIRFIQSPQHRPDDRLQVILGVRQSHANDRPYARLDSLYRLIFLEIQEPVQLEKIHFALGIMHLRSLKKGLFAWTQWTSDRHIIEELLELRPGDLILLFDRLLSLVTFDEDDIRIFHKSLLEYLLDSSRSGDLQLDLGLIHETAANHILKERKKQDSWDLTEFYYFAYHCQFAHLNDTLTSHLRSLACNPKLAFTESLSRLIKPSKRTSLLQSVLYFLQVICRQDFDSSGRCYREYVEKETQYFRSAVPLSHPLKGLTMLTRLAVIQQSAYFETKFLLSFKNIFGFPALERREMNGFNGRTPIPTFNTTVLESIKQEHKMFSSYVKAHHGFSAIVVSFLETNAELIHSCHFAIPPAPVSTLVAFVMLVTYTKYGVRLSCSEFEGVISLDYSLRANLRSLVEQHLRYTQIDNNETTVHSPPYFRFPVQHDKSSKRT